MTAIKTYHRPQDMDEAIGLLTQPGVTTAVLAGGTELNVDKAEAVDAVVDLQALGLEGIEQKGDRLIIRAMTRLQALVESGNTPDLIRETAHREGPNTFRNQGTIGGVIADADSESELLAACWSVKQRSRFRPRAVFAPWRSQQSWLMSMDRLLMASSPQSLWPLQARPPVAG